MFYFYSDIQLPLVPLCCWLGDRKSTRSVKKLLLQNHLRWQLSQWVG